MFDDEEEDVDDEAEDEETYEEEDNELDEAMRQADLREQAKLRHEIGQLNQHNEAQRLYYKQEIRSLLEPLIVKHRALKADTTDRQREFDGYIQTQAEADNAFRARIQVERDAYDALQGRCDVLEIDHRLSRRLQAELAEADSQIVTLDGRIADMERDCRKLENTIADRERDLAGIRAQIAEVDARTQEWQRRVDQTLIENTSEIAIYSDQIRETHAQSDVMKAQAAEFTQVDHLIPELYAALRDEKETIDSIEQLLFPPAPAPRVKVVKAAARQPEAAMAGGGGRGGFDDEPTMGRADWETVATDEPMDIGLDDLGEDPLADGVTAGSGDWPDADGHTVSDPVLDDSEDIPDQPAWDAHTGDPGAAWTEADDLAEAEDRAIAIAWDAVVEAQPIRITMSGSADEFMAEAGFEMPDLSPPPPDDATNEVLYRQQQRDEWLAYGKPPDAVDDTPPPVRPSGFRWSTRPGTEQVASLLSDFSQDRSPADVGETSEVEDEPVAEALQSVGAVGIPGFDDD
ncbi:MAG: hypothetical protein H7338_23555 [Candidatus Sericytochromatia bacterium]|nr:hypothetical protein [Candidatus Sericytochromatia bacterium]